ncbi:MAG: FtsX-like permease family protein [Bacteroidaceae bacterium]
MMKSDSFIKILSLTIGLTIGLLLIAKVRLEENFDACVRDKDHVYQLHETIQRQGSESEQYQATSGGVVDKMREYIPEMVAGTRYTIIYEDENVQMEDQRRVAFGIALCADSNFFDIFSSRVLMGEEHRILSTPGQCMVSRRLYERMGENVLGKTLTFLSASDKPLTIAGVYETFDENTTMDRADILISMPSIGNYTYDGSHDLMGNDRYRSYVRLRTDADMSKVEAEMGKMLQENLPWDEIRLMGYQDVGIRMEPVADAHLKDTRVRTTCMILLIVALVMLTAAVMNYMLVIISSLVARARQVAVRKCMGAPRREFYVRTLGEAALHLMVSLLLMSVVLWGGQDVVRDLLGASVSTLFSMQTIFILTSVCAVVLLCCGLLPAYIYARLPLVYAYRLYCESRRVWKLGLLASQLLLCAMLLSVLVVITRQYDYLLRKDMGYDFQEVAYARVNFPGDRFSDKGYALAREIEKLSSVESVTCAYSLFCERQSGDNVMLPDSVRELFNCANGFFAEHNLVQTMGLKLVEGKGFTPMNHSGWEPELLVDETFARKAKQLLGWDNVVGRYVINSALGEKFPLKIVGVVKDFVMGSLLNPDDRPMMVMNGSVWPNRILIRFHHLTPEYLTQVQELCSQLYPDADVVVRPYAAELADGYVETLRTRNLITIGSVATFIIMLVGLIGYVRDEVQRRSRELAIRKVMGASVLQLQTLFLRSIALIALPSILLGTGLGYWLSTLLMHQFPSKINLSCWMFVLSAAIVFLLTFVVIIWQTYRVATKNPVDNIRVE